MTKLFSEYLTESKRVFEFKVKIAGELPEGFKKKVKMALAKYEATKISAVKKTVVQEHPLDFPKLQNKEVHIFDISLKTRSFRLTILMFLIVMFLIIYLNQIAYN